MTGGKKQRRKKLVDRIMQVVKIGILLYMGAVVVFEYLGAVNALTEYGAWFTVSGQTRTELYYVNASTSDAFLQTDFSAFSRTATVQPFRMDGYDIMGGLIYNLSDRVFNDTHRERASSAFLEFWSDDQTMLPDGSISFYMINQSTIAPFVNYGALNTAPTPWFVGTIALSEFGRGPEPLGFEGWRSGSAKFLRNAVDKVGDTDFFPYLDGTALGLTYLSIGGSLEHFQTFDMNASHAPRISVTWQMFEWVNATPPDGYDGDDFVKEYEGYYIWEKDALPTNRTGAGLDVNWNTVNVTELTEIDSGDSLSRDNATQITITSLVAQEIDSIYNDTGGLGVSGFFVRFSLNTTNVFNAEPFTDRTVTLAGLSTASPVGGSGLLYGAGGDFVGLAMQVYDDDNRYGFRLMDRSGVDRQYSGSSQTFNDFDSVRLYFEYIATDTWEMATVYSDPAFEVPIWNQTRVYATASGPFRYTQLISSTVLNLMRINNAVYSTYVDSPINVDESIIVVADQNGTLLDDLYPDAFDDTYDDLDDLENDIDRLLQGIDPSFDAQPDLGNTLILLMGLMGMIMIPGSFIMLGHMIKEGDWVAGFYYLLMFFFLGLGFVTVWLFG